MKNVVGMHPSEKRITVGDLLASADVIHIGKEVYNSGNSASYRP